MILIKILKDHVLIIVDQILSISEDFPFEPEKFHKNKFRGDRSRGKKRNF